MNYLITNIITNKRVIVVNIRMIVKYLKFQEKLYCNNLIWILLISLNVVIELIRDRKDSINFNHIKNHRLLILLMHLVKRILFSKKSKILSIITTHLITK